MPRRGYLLSAPQVQPSTFQLPLSRPTSHLLSSTVDQLVMPSPKVTPLAANDAVPMGYRNYKTAKDCNKKYLTWKTLSIAALLINACSACCMLVAYTEGQWEVRTL